MPDLKLRVEAAAAVPRAAAPMMSFRIRVMNQRRARVSMAVLGCRIEIDPPRLPCTAGERDRMQHLFGESSGWTETTDTLLWTSSTMMVPAFSESVDCELLAPCSFDFNVAATKYFYGLDQPAAPLRFHFSGQACFENRSGRVQWTSIGEEQSRYALPLTAWSKLMDDYYPESMWLRLPRQTFERFYQYKVDRGIASWEDLFEELLPAPQGVVN